MGEGRAVARRLGCVDGNESVSGIYVASLPRIRRPMVLFPQPDSPTRPKVSPRFTVKFTSSTAWSTPRAVLKYFFRCRTSKMFSFSANADHLPSRLENAYPHELDGGRRQRVGIARALSLRPKFIVCDEPVSSLDVSIQAQVLNLLKELQAEYGLTYLFITHDLSVVKYFSDKIAVMYLGQLVETASSEELFRSTLHPYSQALLSAIPEPSVHRKMQRVKLTGELTSPIDPQPGCRFAKRCLYARESCVGTDPVLREFGCDHFCSCFRTNALQDEE